MTNQTLSVQASELGGSAGMASHNMTAFSNESEYSPIAIAMSFYGSPQTNRAFAWYTQYDNVAGAPANVLESFVEIAPRGSSFESAEMKRFEGESQVLDLKIDGSTNGKFISHKVLAEQLTPGTEYQYRVGTDGLWSKTGYFTTEGVNEQAYEFLYLTDSQGSKTSDYTMWADTLRQGLNKFPQSKFLVMTGDMVDTGNHENQWLDYFGEPQDMLMNLPLSAAVGNHEGPYNDNYYYHFNYPNDSIDDPLPPGSVYSYDFGDAHYMIINTMDMAWDDRQRAAFEQQIEWLRHEVANTDKKWKIVGFHKAIYSVGGHVLDRDILELREMLYPVFDELGIDVVLQGHDHSYMRSYQMYNDKPIKDVDINELDQVVNPDGTLYLINNTAGTKFYGVREDVDAYYAAVSEQAYKSVYSGISMTENTFAMESYLFGENEPFDKYAIERTDGKPNKVEQLTAGVTGNNELTLAWSKPSIEDEQDPVRGFRIYETSGKVARNWTAYVPVEEGQERYQFTIAELDPDEEYEFAVRAVDKRDNSEISVVSSVTTKPAAPTGLITNNGFHTIDWTNVSGFSELVDYEYSTDFGATWSAVAAKPQFIGAQDYQAGAVMIRVKANARPGLSAGHELVSNQSFTENDAHATYEITGTLKRGTTQLFAQLSVVQKAQYNKTAQVIVQLMKGDEPVLINAIPMDQEKISIPQYFNVSGTDYSIKVFVFDTFNSQAKAPIALANVLELK